jgi:SAM-dependent methyltransferase
MRQDVIARLQRINLEFYQTFAEAFASTRRRLQPGALRAIRAVPPSSSVLDLACGTGELARGLARRGYHGEYLGIDASPAMLDIARERAPHVWAKFQMADLSQDDWPEGLGQRYDRAFLLAALHHVPGDDLRANLLHKILLSIHPSGSLTLSVWDFEASPRMRRRVVPWEVAGVQQADVDPNDYLLDWRHGGTGIRYVHPFSDDELSSLAARTGYRIADRYRSDGEGGRLGIYHVWVPQDDRRLSTS